MAKNQGKGFEEAVRKSFEKIPNVSIDRIPDQLSKFKGSTNICDFVVYKYPTQFYLECKSVHGNTLSIYSEPKMGKDGKLHGFYGNIRDNQWEGLLEKSEINGVVAGILCWWIDKDVTRFIPIKMLKYVRDYGGLKSIRYDMSGAEAFGQLMGYRSLLIDGEMKRVYFDYDMRPLLKLKNKEEE